MISVIIPVFNELMTLRRCVDSFLAQTYTDFELLLVDDGSNDGSSSLCNSLAVIDPRIRVFHQHHTGAGAARQLGLTNAKGDYIIHADADDWVEPKMLSEMYQVAVDSHADIISAEMWVESTEGKQITQSDIPHDSLDFFLGVLEGRIRASLCNKLIRANCCHNIPFEPNTSYLEDMVWLLRLASSKSLTFACIDKAYYHYVAIGPSTTRFTSRINCLGRWSALHCIESILADITTPISPSRQKEYYKAFRIQQLSALVSACRSGYFSYKELSVWKKQLPPYWQLPIRHVLKYWSITIVCLIPGARRFLNWRSHGNY